MQSSNANGSFHNFQSILLRHKTINANWMLIRLISIFGWLAWLVSACYHRLITTHLYILTNWSLPLSQSSHEAWASNPLMWLLVFIKVFIVSASDGDWIWPVAHQQYFSKLLSSGLSSKIFEITIYLTRGGKCWTSGGGWRCLVTCNMLRASNSKSNYNYWWTDSRSMWR